MKPPYKIKGAYPQNYIVDADGADVVTQLRCDLQDETDYMQILCDALNANSDPTMRVVEIPAEMYPLPDLPKGKSRWIGRGCFYAEKHGPFPHRKIRFWEEDCNEWQTDSFFMNSTFHIEAV